MDHERIRVEDFVINIKKSYKSIIKFGYSPEQFFGIAREKNRKIEEEPDGGHIIAKKAQKIEIDDKCTVNYIKNLPMELLALILSHFELK